MLRQDLFWAMTGLIFLMVPQLCGIRLWNPIAKKLSVGTGVWAGGQRNVTRLDLGPHADFSVPLGEKTARVALDWRVRVAGDARPKSGVAITLSTSF